MKLHLPTRLRSAVLACVSTVAAMVSTVGTGVLSTGAVAYTAAVSQANAVTLDDAVLKLGDFSEAALQASASGGWAYQNITSSAQGTFVSGSSQAKITNETDWATLQGTNRVQWSAIVKLDADSLLSNTATSGILVQSEGLGGVGFSNGSLTGAWTGNAWTNMTLGQAMNRCIDGDGSLTIGVVTLGDGGTSIYLCDGKGNVYTATNTGLRGGSSNLHPNMLLTSAVGVEYQELYVFGTAVDGTELGNIMKTLVTAPTTQDLVWNGTTAAHEWNTTDSNWLSGGAAAQFKNQDNVVFDATAAVKSVDILGNVSANGVAVNDNYTFTAGNDVSLSAITLTIAQDKTLTVAGGAVRTGTLDGAGCLDISAGAAAYVTDPLNSFSYLVTGEGDLHLAMANKAEGGDDSRIILAEGSNIANIYIENGCFAVNLNQQAPSSVLAGADLHMDRGTFLIRNGVGTGDVSPTENVYLKGDVILRAYGSVTAGTTLSTNFIQEEGQTSSLKRTDGGAFVLTGKIGVDIMYIQAGTTILGEGNETTLSQLRMGEQGAGGLTVSDGAKLVISGTNNTSTTSRSLLLAHWNQTPTLTMEGGEITAEGAHMYMSWDGTGTFAATGGTANLLGLDFTAHSGNKGHVLLGNATEGSARINLGADGIVGLAGSADLQLGEGTMGATADWITAEGSIAAHLVGTVKGTVFDTSNAEDAEHGFTITLNNGFDGDGKLAKDGMGTLALKGASTYTGGTTVNGGVLQVGNATALGTGAVTVAGGTLEIAASASLAGQTLTQTGGSISVLADQTLTLGNATLTATITNAGTVAFSTGTVNLDGLEVQSVTAGYIDEDGDEEATEGFVKNGSKYVQLVTENSTVSAAAGTVFSHKDAKGTVTLDTTTGRAIVEAAADTDWTTFEIKAQSHNLTNIAQKSAAEKSAIAKVVISGGSLAVDSTALSGGTVEATGGTVTINNTLGTLDVKSTTSLTVEGTAAATNVNVLESATIGGAFKASNFAAGTGITATVSGAAELGTLAVQGTLALQGAAKATAGTVNALTTGEGASLTTTGNLALTTASGAGSLDIGGSLTLGGAVSLTGVKAGSVVLGTGSSLSLTGALDSAAVQLATVSTTDSFVSADSLAATAVNFTVDATMVAGLGLAEGDTVTLAQLTQAYTGTLTVNNGANVYISGDQLCYAISRDTETNNIILTAQAVKGEYVWDDKSGDNNWGTAANWAGNQLPDETSWVQVDKSATIIMDVDGLADRVTIYKGADVSLEGDNALDVTSILEVNEDGTLSLTDDVEVSAPQANVQGTLELMDQAALTTETLDLCRKDGSTSGILSVDSGATVTTGVLTGDADSVLEGPGTVTITGKGSRYQGNYAGATVAVAKGGDAVLYAGEGMNLAGAGSAQLVYTQDTAISSIQADGLTLTLNNAAADNSGVTLALEDGSSLKNGKILTGLSAVGTAATIDSADAPTLVSTTASPLKRSAGTPGLDLTGSTVVLTQSEGADVTQMEVNNGGKTKGLVLAYLGAANTESAVQLNGNLFAKYYKNARLVGGEILVDMNDTYYQGLVRPTTANGRAGTAMLDDAFVLANPQQTSPDSDLAKLMDALESGAVPAAGADKLAAAVSGASAAAMGAAFGADVDRQLRAIRNRTTSMGCAECVVNENMPYVNAWVNAEGDYRKLDADNTLAGYKMSSWGATLGVDLDFTNRFTAGLAVTAMQGDFTADSAETATGDLDRLYLSAFARYSRRAWTHTAVATFGKADANLKRTVDYGTGSYTAKGDMSGTAFGLMYEVGYTKALTEDASVCLQPVFNISYRHSALGSYTETGSDAALRMGEMEMDTVTFGLGARLQGTVGTSVYNRTSVVELRALAKLDAGDRDCAAKAGIAGLPAASREVQSAEYGAFGLEVGAGLMVPLGEEGGTLFFDAGAELRSSYSNVNGTVGYRFNF